MGDSRTLASMATTGMQGQLEIRLRGKYDIGKPFRPGQQHRFLRPYFNR
jgi:hypothetical protein